MLRINEFTYKIEEKDIKDKFAQRLSDTNKGDFGYVGILVGMLGYNEPDILTVAAGAYLNGMAGEIAQEKYTDISMVASDTAKCLPEAVKKIREA